MKKAVSGRLQQDLPRLVRAGVIDDATAVRIRDFYAGEPDASAFFSSASTEPPPEGDWLTSTVKYVTHTGRTAVIEVPFDRYYMEDSLAPAAEQAVQDRAGQTSRVAVAVRVLRGKAVIEQLLIEGVPIEDWLKALADTD